MSDHLNLLREIKRSNNSWTYTRSYPQFVKIGDTVINVNCIAYIERNKKGIHVYTLYDGNYYEDNITVEAFLRRIES